MSLKSSRACFDSFLAFSASFSVSTSLASTSSSLEPSQKERVSAHDVLFSPVHSFHVGSHSLNFGSNLGDFCVHFSHNFSRTILYPRCLVAIRGRIRLLAHLFLFFVKPVEIHFDSIVLYIPRPLRLILVINIHPFRCLTLLEV